MDDNTLLHFLAFQRYHLQKYVLQTKQQIYLEPFYVSDVFYQTLTEGEKQLLREAVRETILWAQEAKKSWIAVRMPELEKSGCLFVELAEDELQRMYRTNYGPLYALMEESLGKEGLERATEVLYSVSGDRKATILPPP